MLRRSKEQNGMQIPEFQHVLVIAMVKLSLNIASCIFTMRSRPANPTWFSPGDALPPIVDIDGWKIGA